MAVTVPRAVRRVLLGLAGLAFVTGAVYLWRTGAITPLTVRSWLLSLGPAAPAIFIGAFVAGAFLGLPGMAFVIGGRLAFGPYVGYAVGLGGGLLAVTVPFVLARRMRRAGRWPCPCPMPSAWIAIARRSVNWWPIMSTSCSPTKPKSPACMRKTRSRPRPKPLVATWPWRR